MASNLSFTDYVAEKLYNEMLLLLTLDGYKVLFHTQLGNKKIKQTIDEVLTE